MNGASATPPAGAAPAASGAPAGGAPAGGAPVSGDPLSGAPLSGAPVSGAPFNAGVAAISGAPLTGFAGILPQPGSSTIPVMPTPPGMAPPAFDPRVVRPPGGPAPLWQMMMQPIVSGNPVHNGFYSPLKTPARMKTPTPPPMADMALSEDAPAEHFREMDKLGFQRLEDKLESMQHSLELKLSEVLLKVEEQGRSSPRKRTRAMTRDAYRQAATSPEASYPTDMRTVSLIPNVSSSMVLFKDQVPSSAEEESSAAVAKEIKHEEKAPKMMLQEQETTKQAEEKSNEALSPLHEQGMPGTIPADGGPTAQAGLGGDEKASQASSDGAASTATATTTSDSDESDDYPDVLVETLQSATRRVSNAFVAFKGQPGVSVLATDAKAVNVKASEAQIQKELEKHLQNARKKASSCKPKGRSKDKAGHHGKHEVWVDGEGACMRCWRKFSNYVKSISFDYQVGVLIVVNTAFLGFEVDQQARGTDASTMVFLGVAETVFSMIFLVELLIRILVWRLRFCCSLWNIFDTFVVMCSVIEECVKYGIGGETGIGKLRLFRLMRVFKLARTLRIIRVLRAFRELRIVMMSMLSCMRSLVWTLCLLFIFIYVMAIFIMVELTSHDNAFDETNNGIKRTEYFGSLPATLLTMYQSFTGGLLWEVPAGALSEIIPWISIPWVLFSGFVVFAIANTVTGIFVDQATKCIQDDARNVGLEEFDMRAARIADLRQAFFSADAEGAGYISQHQLSKLCKNKQVAAKLRECDVDVQDVLALFELISTVDMKVPLEDIDAFIRGIFRIKGTARQLDVVALSCRQKAMAQKWHKEEQHLRASIGTIERSLVARNSNR
eukprot:TRINITY_DN6529_c0_g1_i1.p1 TRINITY_DN6529_c0_g1~~TRINITY_DN6529_c0_g1_i1.p1  ORF type:complete len:837 (+),score=213.27 TRINITY_DN6529_c0_g1_i1:178-2688(+)